MRTLTPNEMKFWQGYLSSLPAAIRPLHPRVEAAFPGNREVADELINLYLSGKKTAGSSLGKDFEINEEPFPAVGNYWIVLDSKNTPCCIVKTIRVVSHSFKDIPDDIAKAEGEGDCSVAYWKKVHEEIFAQYLKKLQINDLQNTEVITEFFEVVYKPHK